MNVLNQLLNNLLHPKKTAMYRLQSIHKTIFYIFLLSLILTCFLAPISIEAFFIKNPSLSKIFIPLLFIFYDFVYTCLSFIFIFLLSTIAWSMKTLMHRRLLYSHLWSITANAITYPVLLLALTQTVYTLPAVFIGLFVLVTAFFQYIMIRSVPKPKSQRYSKVTPMKRNQRK